MLKEECFIICPHQGHKIICVKVTMCNITASARAAARWAGGALFAAASVAAVRKLQEKRAAAAGTLPAYPQIN